MLEFNPVALVFVILGLILIGFNDPLSAIGVFLIVWGNNIGKDE
jgi:hypothetical protein